jgi:hypothetical protein
MLTEKIIIEELSRIKSLFGYERGKVISEQAIISEQNQTRQEVINSMYCGMDANGNLTAPGWQGKPFNEYAQGLTEPITATELATAKASCPAKTAPQTSQQNQNYFGNQYSGGFTAPVGSFDNMTLVDCRNYIKAPLALPGGALQNQFHKASAIDYNIEENKKLYCDAEYMKSYLQKQNQPNTTTKKTPSTPPCSLPPELKDVEGVKSFQDWLDENHAGWATGYDNGVLNKTGKGYGRMGPRTCKAWPKYKNEYLNKPTAVNTGYEEYGGVSGDVQSSGNVGQTPTGNVGQTPTGNVGQTPTGNQSNLEQMPMRDADYFNGYQ